MSLFHTLIHTDKQGLFFYSHNDTNPMRFDAWLIWNKNSFGFEACISVSPAGQNHKPLVGQVSTLWGGQRLLIAFSSLDICEKRHYIQGAKIHDTKRHYQPVAGQGVSQCYRNLFFSCGRWRKCSQGRFLRWTDACGHSPKSERADGAISSSYSTSLIILELLTLSPWYDVNGSA